MNSKQIKFLFLYPLPALGLYIGAGSLPWEVWTLLIFGYIGGFIAFRKPKEPTSTH